MADNVVDISAAQALQAKRSLRPDIRNPLLQLKPMQEIAALAQSDSPIPPEKLRELLSAIYDQADRNAETSWRKHKAPMALYWKVIKVYAGHIRRAMTPRPTLRVVS